MYLLKYFIYRRAQLLQESTSYHNFRKNNLPYLTTEAMQLNKAKITIWKLWCRMSFRQKDCTTLFYDMH